MLSRACVLWTVLLAADAAVAEDVSASPDALLDDASDQQRLLKQKCEELDRLQREVNQLRAATGTPEPMTVSVQVLEVSLTKLRKLGIDPGWISNGTHARPIDRNADEIASLVDELKRKHLAKMITESTVAVVSGLPVSLNHGGEVPVPVQVPTDRDSQPSLDLFPKPVPNDRDSQLTVEFMKFGTSIDIAANALGDERVRLDVRTRLSRIDDRRSVELSGNSVPGSYVREFENATELPLGRTAVFTGLVERRVEAEVRGEKVHEEVNEVQLVTLVTPEAVPAPDVPDAHAKRKSRRVLRR